jgi:pyruvate/2-oxoglutarate dehydrogenase complex dihydrolipoamide dehydrogenase (E3) component
MSNTQPPPLERDCDFAVIGAGPAGLTAARAANRLGFKVALVERDRLGGNSFNSGTIPSKSLIQTARLYAAMQEAEAFGAGRAEGQTISFAAVISRMQRLRARVAGHHSADRLAALGIDLVRGDARFVGPHALTVGNTLLRFRKALVATGARPRHSDIPGLEDIGYQTSDTVFDMEALPECLTVVGGGPVGCELAQAFCRLGARITIVQRQPKFLPLEERDAAELLSRTMARDGVIIRLNTRVVGARRENGRKILQTLNDEVNSTIETDDVILSIGRVPNVDGMGLDRALVAYDAQRGIAVDEALCTSNPDIYAAGDVCTARRFANVAEASAGLAVQNALGGKTLRHSDLVGPWCTYCDPEIAHIGLQVRHARLEGIPIKTYTVMMHDVDRAITDGRDDGFVKLHIREGTDEILGATIVASHASEMINEVSVVMQAKLGMRDLARTLHTYPAQSDAIRMAAVAYVESMPAG